MNGLRPGQNERVAIVGRYSQRLSALGAIGQRPAVATGRLRQVDRMAGRINRRGAVIHRGTVRRPRGSSRSGYGLATGNLHYVACGQAAHHCRPVGRDKRVAPCTAYHRRGVAAIGNQRVAVGRRGQQRPTRAIRHNPTSDTTGLRQIDVVAHIGDRHRAIIHAARIRRPSPSQRYIKRRTDGNLHHIASH